ncbi:MAG: rhomboid family intramembrane serine protease [Azonexus sp.]|jgi:membrane associated rhomboid family serine protease|nr:rhomboid family intramembrane serine protease [Azonexus sp.]
MFLMPYLRNVTRPHIPFGVILLVLVNAFVFFGLQSRDEGRYQRAFAYYEQSVLPGLELPAYEDYLKKMRRADDLRRFEQLGKIRETRFIAIRLMNDDEDFLRHLRAGRIILPDHADYLAWQAARRQFDQLMAGVTIERYAFHTSQPSWLTAITHQYLHGGAGHLIGNMVVLIVLAPAVEALVGTGVFLLLYTLGGLAAVGMYWLLATADAGLVGASGAISAVMGAFAVLLRWRRIPFFYFVLVYFDIVTAPALLALPVWLANEALQMYWNGNSHIAYSAHFGGLLAGALLAWPLVKRAQARLLPEPGKAKNAPAAAKTAPQYLAEARRATGGGAFDQARRAYASAALQPDSNLAVWSECFNVLKLSPGSEEFHKTARAILGQRADDAATQGFILEVFRDYIALAKPRPYLNGNLLVRLGERFRRHGSALELERVARLLHIAAPDDPRCREFLLAAANAHARHGDAQRSAALMQLAAEYPAV